jgi:hypothetical protein
MPAPRPSRLRKPKAALHDCDGRWAPFTLAGLWENWKDPESGDWVRTFTTITPDANELVAGLRKRWPRKHWPGFDAGWTAVAHPGLGTLMASDRAPHDSVVQQLCLVVQALTSSALFASEAHAVPVLCLVGMDEHGAIAVKLAESCQIGREGKALIP